MILAINHTKIAHGFIFIHRRGFNNSWIFNTLESLGQNLDEPELGGGEGGKRKRKLIIFILQKISFSIAGLRRHGKKSTPCQAWLWLGRQADR